MERKKSFVSENNFEKEKKVVIFVDSIPRGIKLHEFNYWFHKGFAQLKSFPRGTCKEPTLQNKKFNIALSYVGVNDLLKDESQDSVQNLLDILKEIGLTCKLARAARTFNFWNCH